MNTDKLLQQAKEKIEADDYEGAITDLNEILVKDSAHIDALIERGFAYYMLEDYESAITDYEEVLHYDPENAQAHNGRGNILVEEEKPEEALAAYNDALRYDPNYITALGNRAELRIDQEEYDGAFEDYSKVLELDEDNVEALVGRASIHQSREDFELAIKDLDRAIEIDPQDREARIQRGTIRQEQLGDEEGAQEDFQIALQSNGEGDEQIEAFLQAGRQAMGVGSQKTDAGALSAAQQKSEKLQQVWQMIMQGQNPEDALPILDELSKDESLAGSVLCLRAMVHQQLGDFQKAIEDANEAIELEPEVGGNYLLRATLYAQTGDLKTALADLNRLLDLEPGMAVGYERRAAILAGLKRYEEALKDAEQSVELAPHESVTYSTRAMIQLSLKKIDEALSDCNESLKLNPNDARTLIIRAQVFYEQDNSSAATDDLQEAAKLDKELADALNPENSEFLSQDWLQTLLDPRHAPKSPGQAGMGEELHYPAPPLTVSTMVGSLLWIILGVLFGAVIGAGVAQVQPVILVCSLTLVLMVPAALLPGAEGRNFPLGAILLAIFSVLLLLNAKEVTAETTFDNRYEVLAWLLSWGLFLGMMLAFGLAYNFGVIMNYLQTSIVTAAFYLRQGFLPGFFLALLLWGSFSLWQYLAWPIFGICAGAMLGAGVAILVGQNLRAFSSQGSMLGLVAGITLAFGGWIPATLANGGLAGMLIGIIVGMISMSSNLAMTLAQSKGTLPNKVWIIAIFGLLIGAALGHSHLNQFFIILRNGLWMSLYWGIGGLFLGIIIGRIAGMFQSSKVLESQLWRNLNLELTEGQPMPMGSIAGGLMALIGAYLGASIGLISGLLIGLLTTIHTLGTYPIWTAYFGGGIVGALVLVQFFGTRPVFAQTLMGLSPMNVSLSERSLMILSVLGVLVGAGVTGLVIYCGASTQLPALLPLGCTIGALIGARLWTMIAV